MIDSLIPRLEKHDHEPTLPIGSKIGLTDTFADILFVLFLNSFPHKFSVPPNINWLVMVQSSPPSVTFSVYVVEIQIPRVQDECIKRSMFYTAQELQSFREEAREEMRQLMLQRLKERFGIGSVEEAKQVYMQLQQTKSVVGKRNLVRTAHDPQPPNKRRRTIRVPCPTAVPAV